MVFQKSVNPQSLVSRTQTLMSAPLGDIEAGVVVLNTESNLYFGMDSVAAYLWQQLDQPRSVEVLVQSVLRDYEVSQEQALADTLRFLSELEQQGLVVIKDG